MFLAGESRQAMMHVAGLLVFSPPPDAEPGFLRELADRLRESTEVKAPWNLKLALPDLLKSPLNAWVEEVGANSPESPQGGPVSKPDAAGLRAFLSECLADSLPGDLRAVDARAANTRDLRISRSGDARTSYVR